MIRYRLLIACWGLLGLSGAGTLLGAEESPKPEPAADLNWHTDYREALKEAADQKKMLFIFFHDVCPTAARRAFEQQTLRDPQVVARLSGYTLAKLPLDAKIQLKGESITLIKHPAFVEMLGRQGIAIIDLAHPKPQLYGYVVSTFPFTSGKFYTVGSVSVILDLPEGSLTQRTMIYAVRMHPERPESTQGQPSTMLANEAASHSNHQAAILLQGHHNWDNRFQRISANVGGTAQEVVAESWPNENLVEACIDCVDSWRQSPGHWGAVRTRHSLFGYDIKCGRNGIWYATGIFGRR